MHGRKKAGRFALLLTAALLLFPTARAAALAEELVPVGQTVGIRLDMDGAMIVGFAQVDSEDGQRAPAQESGLLPGDIISGLNGRKISSCAEFLTAAQELTGESAQLTVERGGREIVCEVTPAKAPDGGYQLGLWLRDGVSGIGTVTYYDPETGAFGALGHGISDAGTAGLIPVGSGCITRAEVIDVIRGGSGSPGELCGRLSDERRGEIDSNTGCGIFGSMEEPGGEALPVAGEDELSLGSATILSNVSGDSVGEYSAEICRIYHSPDDDRCFMISVTDPELLAATGGIVQGMSGSPVLQNGKLVGAVTHVLVSDPTRGYGISIERMLEAAQDGQAA